MEREKYIKERLIYFNSRVTEINYLIRLNKTDTDTTYYKDERAWYRFLISELESILDIKD